MTKLVAFKIEVALSAESMSKQPAETSVRKRSTFIRAEKHLPDHLVDTQAPLNCWCALRQVTHVRVHLLVHEPEGKGLVTHQSLVVTLRVADALLIVSPVDERPADRVEIPILIFCFLENLRATRYLSVATVISNSRNDTVP